MLEIPSPVWWLSFILHSLHWATWWMFHFIIFPFVFIALICPVREICSYPQVMEIFPSRSFVVLPLTFSIYSASTICVCVCVCMKVSLDLELIPPILSSSSFGPWIPSTRQAAIGYVCVPGVWIPSVRPSQSKASSPSDTRRLFFVLCPWSLYY